MVFLWLLNEAQADYIVDGERFTREGAKLYKINFPIVYSI